MPKQHHLEVATNSYLTKCGEVKYIHSDRDSTLKLWYKLHRKKCAVCKDVPYKFREQHYTATTSSVDIADHQRKLNQMLNEIDYRIPITDLMTKKN